MTSELSSENFDVSFYAFNKDYLMETIDFSLIFKKLGDEHNDIIKKQYSWLEKYTKDKYKKKRKEYFESIKAKFNAVEINTYYVNLLKFYLKTYVLNIYNSTDLQIDNINIKDIPNFNFNEEIRETGIKIFDLVEKIFYKYFSIIFDKLKLVNDTRVKIPDIIPPIQKITIDKTADLDKFNNTYFVYNKDDFIYAYNKLNENISEFSDIQKSVFDFINNKYIIEEEKFSISDNESIDMSELTLRNNKDILGFILDNNISLEEYKYYRLLCKNKKLTKEDFLKIFVKPSSTNPVDSKNTNANLNDKFNILLNSIKNRLDILNTTTTIPLLFKSYNGFLSKAFLTYYIDLLNKFYQYLNKNIDKIYKPDIVASLTISILLYRSLFNFFIDNMKDDEAISIKDITNLFPNSINLLQLFFIELKPFLDQYKLSHNTSKIRIFCKINDIRSSIERLNITQKKIIGLNNKKSRVFNISENTKNTLNIVDGLKMINKNVGVNTYDQITFTKVFDSDTNNGIVTSYIGLGNTLENLEGTIFYTFGASGTGKSYTLFGEPGNPGVLKSAISSITDVKNIYIKIFEIYGFGFNDIDYWNNKSVFEKYIVHNIEFKDGTFIYKKTSDDKDSIDIYNFDEFKEKNSSFDSYIKIPGELTIEYLNLGFLSDEIDKRRKTGYVFNNSIIKTIKPTSNNPISSRSILVYEFIIEKNITINKNNTSTTEVVQIPLILVDMPGKEIINTSYGCVASPITCKHNLTINNKYSSTLCTKCENELLNYRSFKLIKNMLNIFSTNDKPAYQDYISNNKKDVDLFNNFYKGIKAKILTIERNKITNDKSLKDIFKEANVDNKLAKAALKIKTDLEKMAFTNPNLTEILQIETILCRSEISEEKNTNRINNFYGILPGELCLNLKRYFSLLPEKSTTSINVPSELIPLLTYIRSKKENNCATPFNSKQLSTTFIHFFGHLKNIYNNIYNTNNNTNSTGNTISNSTNNTNSSTNSISYNFFKLSEELAKYTDQYYRLPLTLKFQGYSLTDFYNEIFEGIYINENINGIMLYMLGNISGKNVNNISIKQIISEREYSEGNIFKKNDMIIKKLFDYYNNNNDRAKIENYVSLFLCSNLSKNQSIYDAINRNVINYNNPSGYGPNKTFKFLYQTEYYREIKSQQIDMFLDFKPIIKDLLQIV